MSSGKFKILIFIFVFFFSIFLSSCSKSSKVNFTEDQLIGDWEAIQGDYEQISFSKEGDQRLFYSYLNGRSFNDGKWSIKGEDIIIELSSGDKEVFKKVKIENGILSFNDGKDQYQRLKTISEKFEELVKKIMSIEGLKFDEPVDTEFEWNLNEDDNISTVTIKGKLLKAKVTLTTDDYTDINEAEKKVVQLLENNRFTVSEYNIAEGGEVGQTGYENGDIKLIINIHSPLNYNPETDENVSIKGSEATLSLLIGFLQ
ncbi:MAG: hypothetical protein WH035_05635 [Spirochaetota bacterium]